MLDYRIFTFGTMYNNVQCYILHSTLVNHRNSRIMHFNSQSDIGKSYCLEPSDGADVAYS